MQAKRGKLRRPWWRDNLINNGKMVIKSIIKGLFYAFCITILACGTATVVNKEAAGYHAQLGLAYLKQGDISLAKKKLLLALQQAPNDPLILDAMGYFLEATGDIELSERYYLQAIKLAPKNGAVQNNYGTFLCRHTRYQESLAYFLLAVKDSNYVNTGQAYKNASLCAAKIPNKHLANEYLRRGMH
jgi:type IV pilus assembly protein PilF